jgi:peptide chain release factor subunit 1
MENDLKKWKIKKLLKQLTTAKGDGTSMISIICAPNEQLSKINNMLTTEMGTATNIKSRTNRQSVLSAITSAQQRLKLYNKTPKNGLFIYVGNVIINNREKKLVIDFEPHRPINTTLYLCDNQFHTSALSDLLNEDEEKYGYIIMDGNGSLFGLLHGNTRQILNKFDVCLPNKQGRGGQSAMRFARLRMEKRHEYVKKVSETAVRIFISNDVVNVKGLVLAGNAEFKNILSESNMFDPRLKDKVVGVIDIMYGSENGFNQAIEKSKHILIDTKYMEEKKILSMFFEEIKLDTGKFCFGVVDTLKILETGAINTLIVWENLNELKDEDDLLDWLLENYNKYGVKQIKIITDNSPEGTQFCKGFGGIGGILTWSITLDEQDHTEFEDVFDEDDFI